MNHRKACKSPKVGNSISQSQKAGEEQRERSWLVKTREIDFGSNPSPKKGFLHQHPWRAEGIKLEPLAR